MTSPLPCVSRYPTVFLFGCLPCQAIFLPLSFICKDMICLYETNEEPRPAKHCQDPAFIQTIRGFSCKAN